MELNFYILRKDKNNRFNIELRGKEVTETGMNQYRFNTGIKVTEKQWDKKKSLCKDPEMKETVNTRLQEIRNLAEKYFITSHTHTTNGFTEWMNNNGKPKAEANKPKEKTLVELMDEFLSNVENRVNSNGETITKNRVENYRRIVSDFKRWLNGRNPMPTDFGGEDVERFFNWLRTDRKLAPNTLNSRNKMFRAMMNDFSKKTAVNKAYKEVAVRGEKVEHIILNDDEIERMMNVNTDGNGKLENVRRLFIIGITTGLRFSDFSNVKLEHLAGDILTIHQQKTGGRVSLPIHPALMELIDNNQLPHTVSNQKFNDYIKQLAIRAGIDTPVEVQKVRGGVRSKNFVPKYELISSHICRRSFASRFYRLGVNPQIIMKLTGHTSLSTFMNYVVIDNSDVYEAIKRVW